MSIRYCNEEIEGDIGEFAALIEVIDDGHVLVYRMIR